MLGYLVFHILRTGSGPQLRHYVAYPPQDGVVTRDVGRGAYGR